MTRFPSCLRFRAGRSILVLATLVLCVALPATVTCAQDAKGIKIKNLKGADLQLMNNHDPASELENFELLDGYEANLFASDPMFANPVHMQWDSKGRLWVACSWAYPQLKPGEKANDKIIILEDTDDDGVADKSTVFADGLYMPTGLELANGGCFVAQSPDVYFLKDTDGDDVADEKELVLTGFGIEDQHHAISAWRRGPGGWIYFQEGIFLHSQVETAYGVVRNFNGGVYQFNPRTRELRMFCRGTGGNPWGHVFDDWGQSFMVNNPRIMYLSPATGNSGGVVRVNPLISTEKQCGGDLATGRHVGEDLRGQLLTGRFKSRAVVRYEFIEDGAGFSANVLKPLISSKHPNFRPVDVKIGPDGAIYVADWYNSIINHAHHDFRDPRRDHEHGRIWRITHKERALVEKPQLVGTTIESLVSQLKSPEAWTRHQARKELSERDPDAVLAALEAWVDLLDADDPEVDHYAVEAMWACQNVERVSEKILKRVLSSEDGHARSAAARTLRYWHSELSDPVRLVAAAATDSFPRTRMEAVLSAGFIPKAESLVAALASLDHPGDKVLNQALPQTITALEKYWQPALEAGTLKFAKPSHREFLEAHSGSGLGSRLNEILDEESPSESDIAAVKGQLIKGGNDDEILTILSKFKRGKSLKSPALTIAILESLQKMVDPKAPKSIIRQFRNLRHLLGQGNESIAVAAAAAIGEWGVADKSDLAALKSDDYSVAVRQAIAIALVSTNRRRYEPELKALSLSGKLGTRYAAVVGLAQGNLPAGVQAAAALLAEDPQDIDPVPLVNALLKRNATKLLVKDLTRAEIHPAVKMRVSQFHRVSGALDADLASLFRTTTGETLTALLRAESMDQLAADALAYGDPAKGELIYRREALACMSCHAIGPAGPQIGPNLVAVGAAAKPNHIVQSILDPNALIAEHYETRKFLLTDGQMQTGIVTFRNENEVLMRDSAQAGKEVRLLVDDIEDERAGRSLMPAGLADQLESRDEFLDLVKFVSSLGTPGPYQNDESPVIRKWSVAATDAGETMPVNKSAWSTVYSKVSGELAPEDFPAGQSQFARGYLNVLVPGELELKINSAAGLKLWVDGELANRVGENLRLEKGRHSLTFGFDSARKEGLRVEFLSPGGKGRFQPEGGF